MKSNRFPWHVVAVASLLVLTLAASKLAAHRQSYSLAQPLDTLSREILGGIGTDDPPLTAGVLRELKCSSYLNRTYKRDRIQAQLFIAYYNEQRAGESMHSPKHCLPGSGWEIWDSDKIQIAAPSQPVSINKYSISNAGQRAVVFYWYQSRGRIVASEYLGKVLLARDTLLQNSTAGSIVRIVVPDEPESVNYAQQFATDLIPRVQQLFGN